MSYNLFLDDFRTPKTAFNHTWFTPFLKEEWVVVKNYDEFVTHIEKSGMPNFIAFDHDLAPEHYAPQDHWDDKYDTWAESQGFEEKTGMDCAKWIIDYCLDNDLKLPEYFVHSQNPAGKKNIESILDNFKKFQENR